ncbi:MAG TPA: hypothetical protein VNA89_06905 [Gemmatimonadaceae bacterium]|nr:hypothetical protein [Gemmatimonadaceae bacterium]
MPRLAIVATILTLVTACDKAKELAAAAKGGDADAPVGERTDLSRRPHIFFQVFGERDDPRMLPLAVIDNGTLKPIMLDAEGWRRFDAMYQRAGATYPVYRGGRPAGSVRVRQGMWEVADRPLYSLPSCQLLTPLAAVAVSGARSQSFTVELFAATADLGANRPGGDSPAARAAARAVATAAAAEAGIDAATVSALSFAAVGASTGATAEPTVVGSFIDPSAEEKAGANGGTAHVFVIADQGANGAYAPTYIHTVNGDAATAEYRRYMDHLDLTGDGVDEMLVEGWTYGGDTQLIVLGWQGGRWRETFRARPNWCLDQRAR